MIATLKGIVAIAVVAVYATQVSVRAETATPRNRTVPDEAVPFVPQGGVVNDYVDVEDKTHTWHPRAPVWPVSTVAERKIPGALSTSPGSILIEEDHGKWAIWILSTRQLGKNSAVNFFTGEVLSPVYVSTDRGTRTFTDPAGVEHAQVQELGLSEAPDQPDARVGHIQINTDFAIFDCTGCAGDIDYSERIEGGIPGASVWKKAPVYPNGAGWSSRISAAVDLGDETLLFIGGGFAFRVHQRDFTPVGSAPSLHVVDERWLEEVIETAKSANVDVTDAYLTDQLSRMRHGK
ncbi:hypothetical protein [Luteibacter sp. 3190]|uniref:hypothetical protein n=1 Tax=Luteibacter sp. 3190 TaxID=2817736 RepID=UPI002865D9A1|nr:hypothetical protein [Luteibacter sp. 3190]MDR6937394.1 hypothetical protein [Luteibacter sp. 3190]